MVTKHIDVFYTNKYLNRFSDEESAEKDEELRDFAPFKVKNLNNLTFSAEIQGDGIEAIDDHGKPWTGQRNDKNRVYLFKDMIIKMQKFIDQYGNNVGYCNQHIGMGNFLQNIVLLEENKKI